MSSQPVPQCKETLEDCPSFKKIQQYLQFHSKNNDDTIITKFCTHHTSMINDYIHIIEQHEREKIINYNFNIPTCTSIGCKSILRRIQRDKRLKSKGNSDVNVINETNKNILDSIHIYCIHSVDQSQNDEKIAEQIESSNDTFNIKSRSSKYCLIPILKEDDELFMDYMYKHLTMNQINKHPAKQIYEMLQDEQFDSDSIKEDVIGLDITSKDSNILNYIESIKSDNNQSQRIGNIFKHYAMKSNEENKLLLFNMGYRFFYHKHYKTNDDVISIGMTAETSQQFTAKQLYVEEKYNSLKQELLLNKQHSLTKNQYETSLKKAIDRLQTDKANSVKANTLADTLKYDIIKGASLTLNHLLAIITYTDYSEFSTAFSSTFRSTNVYDGLDIIKSKNREFAVLSKSLRELVEVYGTSMGSANFESVYFGMPILPLPSYHIFLHGPTSTSATEQIAIQFADDNGMVVKLQEAHHWGGNRLTYFDARWVSDFADENERLFFGGMFAIRVKSVTITEGVVNFETFCQTLYLFDCMVSGVSFTPSLIRKENICSKDDAILKALIESKLGISDSPQLKDKTYIINSFKAMCDYKKNIVINIANINEHLTVLKNNIFITDGNILNVNKICKLFPKMQNIKIIVEENDDHKNEFDVKSLVLKSVETMRYQSSRKKLKSIQIWVARDVETDGSSHESWAYSQFNEIQDSQVINIKIIYQQKTDLNEPYDVLFIMKKMQKIKL